MARIQSRRANSAAPAADLRRRILTNRKKPAYQVVIEQVTQKWKKLITAGCFQTEPPKGYTFIPAGDPQITNRCKQLSRLDSAKVYIVSTPRSRTDLSIQVHRIGYHFPSSIVARACTSLGIDLSRNGRVLHNQAGLSLDSGLEQALERRNVFNPRTQEILHPRDSQASIDTQAREAIKDLFPKIPMKDLHAIVTRAFEKDRGLVGTAPDLPLARRVQLAVVAHIRHNYTDYDALLRRVSWPTARAMAEKPSLDKLAEWRADNEDHPNAVEEILREVIVIPDDDEDDEGSLYEASGPSSRATRQRDMDINSSRITQDELETRAVDYGIHNGAQSRLGSTESDEAGEIQFLGYGQYVIARQDKGDQHEVQRIGAHRQRAWEQALSRRRREPELVPIIEDRVRVYEPLPSGRSTLNPVNEHNIYPQLEETYARQVQLPLQDSVKFTYLERVTPTTQQETHVGRLNNPFQVHNPYGRHENPRLIKEVYPRNIDRSNLASASDMSPGSTNSTKGKSSDQRSNAVRQEISPQQRSVTHFQGSHLERVLPSIEGSSQPQGIVSSERIPRQSTHLHVIDGNYQHVSMHTGLLNFSNHHGQTRNAELDSNPNSSKRRRVTSPVEIIQRRTEPYTALQNTQKTVLIPIEQYNNQGEELQWSSGNQLAGGVQPNMVEDYSMRNRPSVQSVPNSHKIQAPLFVRSKDNGNFVKIVPESSHHSQVLVSPGLSQSGSNSHTFQRLEKSSLSVNQTGLYGSSDSYRELRLDKPATSQEKSNINTPRTTNLVYRDGEPGSLQTLIPSNYPQSQASTANSAKNYRHAVRKPAHEPLQSSRHEMQLEKRSRLLPLESGRHDVPIERKRVSLPLEKSFQKVQPVQEVTSPHWREPQPSPVSDIDHSVRGILYQEASHYDAEQRPLDHAGHKAVYHGNTVTPTYYGGFRQSIPLRQQENRGIQLKGHDSIRKNESVTDRIYENNGLTNQRQGQRMFDKYSGREVIILE